MMEIKLGISEKGTGIEIDGGAKWGSIRHGLCSLVKQICNKCELNETSRMLFALQLMEATNPRVGIDPIEDKLVELLKVLKNSTTKKKEETDSGK